MRKLFTTSKSKNGICFYKQFSKILFVFLIILFFTANILSQCTSVSGEISGIVSNDVNFNNSFDVNDEGIDGIKVFVYDNHQQVVTETITDVNGKYKLTGLNDGSKYRLEFEFSDLYYLSKNNLDIRFIQSPSCDNDLLLHKPVEYGYPDPQLAMAMFIQGAPSEYRSKSAVLSFDSKFTPLSTYSGVADKSDVGSIWGLAFSRTKQQLFTSAFVKQYAYLGEGGLGAIYVNNRTSNGWESSLYVDLVSEGIDLGNLKVSDAQDCDYGSQVGKIGLGSLALSEDEKYIYVTNLFKNELIKIPTDKNKLNEIEEIPVPNPNCIGGKMHVFALKSYLGNIYVGVSCGAEYIEDESFNTLHIYEYDPINEIFGEIFESDYPKGYLHDSPSDDVNVQHWLTDIDFTDEGNMVLVLNDRVGQRYCKGTQGRLDVQNGDILLAWNNDGIWELENNGQVDIYYGSGIGNNEGPGGGEFFGFDAWSKNAALHPETSTGSALVIGGSGEVIVPVYDPELSSYSGGLKSFKTSNGDLNSTSSIYTHKIFPQMGKASGFGDLDAIYDPLPLEIGDFVWLDKDNDGIQDPNEKGISALEISLFDDNCNVVGRTITDLNGYYVFNNTNVDLNGDGENDELDILKKYYVVIDDIRFSSSQLNKDGKIYYLTVLNKGVGSNKDKNDSDALIARNICNIFNDKPYVEVFTESSGQNMYDADFGFSEVEIFDLALRKTVVGNSTVQYGDVITFKISVYNQGTIEAHDIVLSDYISLGYEVDPLDNTEWVFNADIDIATYTHALTLKPGASFDIFIKMKIKPGFSVEEFINYAEINSALNPEGNLGIDVDSSPDSDSENDIGGVVDFGNINSILITDNVIDDDGTYDEDDHDPAVPKILDLALRKEVVDEDQIFVNGDTVQFVFNVFNQGTVIATSYEIVDYLSKDFIFDYNLNSGWAIENDSIVVYQITEELVPFAKKEIFITLIINEKAKVDKLLNYGEISNEQIEGEVTPKDFDSFYNMVRSDDVGAKPGTSSDDLIYGSAHSVVADEDDHDVAEIKIYNYDLALVKKALNHNVKEGDKIKFEIEIFNQGVITADKISIVDYLDTGFKLEDSKWNLNPNDNTKAEITLSVDNGLLPPFGLLPGKSIIIDITLLLQSVPVNIDFLTNTAEISLSFDIAGNNLGIYDKDSSPDDIKDNDKKGNDNQLDGNGIDDEDDHDWATVFVRSSIVVDPCICLHNATNENDGQFSIEINIVSPSGQNWVIDSLDKFYDIAILGPAIPVLYPLGTGMTEVVDLLTGLSVYTINGIHVENIAYYVRFKNNLGDKIETAMLPGVCAYDNPEVVGPTGACMNSIEDYTIINFDPTATYTWSLPNSGGVFVGTNTGENVTVNWGAVNGVYDLEITITGGMNCIAPRTIEIEIGNSSGAFSSEDYVISSVDYNCELEVTPEIILTTPVNPNTPFSIVLFDPEGNMLPSNIITSEYIGMDIMVKLIDLCGGQQAMTVIKAFDKQKPSFICEDINVDCDNMKDYPGPLVMDNCDVDPQVLIVHEITNYEDCTSGFTKTITRKYLAVDKWDNISDTCTQKISVNRINGLEIEYPENFLIADNTALTCNTFAVDDEGNPSPSVTGTPHYHGRNLFNICEDNFCETSVGYHDFVIADIGCAKIIERSWYVFENCLGFIGLGIQSIEIHDLIPPLPVAPDNIIVTTDGLNCSAIIQLPTLEISDNCSSEFKVDISYPNGFKENSNGANVVLPLGIHEIVYSVYDNCDNLSQVSMTVTVEDITPPVAICQTNTVVSLPPSGVAYVPALSFNSGSYDDCGLAEIEARRMFGGVLASSVPFECNDLDSSSIMIVLRATDASGNWNECMVSIEVQHKYPPTISCPDSIEVECDFIYNVDSLSKFFGNAVGTDVCGVTLTEYDAIYDINNCGVGTILRHFEATGRGGLKKDCEQIITFINSNPFTLNDISWPKDYTTNVCGNDKLNPDNLGWPVLNEGQCDLVSMNYEDQEFKGLQGDACYTIVRTWTVLDECQMVGNQFKRWNYDQLIHVINENDPFIQILEDIDTCTYDSNCKFGDVILEAIGSDDCTNPDDLQWTYQIDLFTDNIIDTTVYQVGAKAIASGEYPIGVHSIIWVVEDRCGNTYARSQVFTINNCTKPTVICKDLIIELGPAVVDGDTVAVAEIIAKYFNNDSYHSCGYPLKFSYSQDVNDTILYLDCSWIRQEAHDITLYVTDINGNFDYCVAQLIVQDNNYICDPFDRCLTYPEDSVVIESCNPDLDPGDGLLDSMIVDRSCGCDTFDISYVDIEIDDDSGNCMMIERSWSADFNCVDLDTTIVFIQIITILNEETPSLNCPLEIIVDASPNCDTYVSIPVPTYLDGGCNTGLFISHDSQYADLQGEDASGIYPEGSTTVTFTLTDDCGNSSTCDVDITVSDVTAPLCVTNDTTVFLNADGNVAITSDFVASGSTDNCGSVVITVSPNAFDCGDVGENTVNIIVSDGANETNCSAIVTVIDTLTELCNAHDTLLILDGNGDLVLDPEDIYSGSGGCGGSNEVTLETEPAEFDCDNLGENIVQLIVTDNVTGESDTCEAIVTIVDTIAPQCLVHDETVFLDENGNVLIIFEIIDNGSFDSCGEIVDTSLSKNSFDCSEIDQVQIVTVTLTDNNNNVSTCEAEITVADSISPICVPNDTTVFLNADGNVTITGDFVASGSTDNCGSVTLTVNPSAFDCGDVGENTVNIIVSDGTNETNCSAIVTVIDTLTELCNAHDTLLILDGNGDLVLDPEDIYSGSGGCGGSNEVTLETEPAEFDCDNLGENTVQLIVTDNVTGESDTCEAIVTIVDTIAPQCLVHDETVFLDENGNASITFEIIDDGSFDSCGEIVDTSLSKNSFDCSEIDQVQIVIVTLTDNNNNVSTCEAEITVADSISPLCVPNDTTVALNADGNVTITGDFVASGSTDNCGSVTLVVDPSAFGCGDIGENTVNITVSDGINETNCSAIVTVIDTLTELCNAHDTLLILDGNGDLVLDPEDIYSGAGGCGGSNDVTLEADPDQFDCDDLGENIVQLIVTDDVTGESDTCEAIVTIVDTIAPQCLVHDETVFLDENGDASITFEIIDNGSFDSCGEIVDTSLSKDSFDCTDIDQVQIVTVTLTDNNNNISTCESEITVLDTIAPVCEAIDTLYLPLDDTGMAVITGQDVDAGSSDQCQIISLEVDPDTFYCNDAGIPIEFILTVTDASGNSSECSGVVIVQDTTPPMMVCPNDTTISCLEIPDESMYVELFGEPEVFDNCSQGIEIIEVAIKNIDNCGDGAITRNFTVTDGSGNTSMCTQLIIIEAEPDFFGEEHITWPEDVITVENCFSIDPDSLNSFPVLDLSDAGCAVITVSYEDIDLNPGSVCNDTIQREWTVVDSCQFDMDPSTGIYLDTQIIIVIDTVAPIIFGPSDTTIDVINDECMNVYVDLFGNVVDCDPNVVVVNDSPYADDPNSADASGSYPEGEWDITITATDQCGNTSTHTFHLIVMFPNYCIKATFEITEDQNVVAYVDEMVSTLPDCADMSLSNTTPDLDSTIYDCSDLGNSEITVYKYNQNGELIDSCVSAITIIDPNGFCGTIVAEITGNVITEDGYAVENTEINLSGNENGDLMTDYNGKFEFTPLIANSYYSVKPNKNNDVLNGVNTLDIVHIQKFVLGIGKFNSPYKMIAADVNNNNKVSASDILLLRQVILGEKENFEVNSSWKFIDSKYIFNNPLNPLNESYPEEFIAENLVNNMNIDFIGIKIGDVNHSVLANTKMEIEDRNSESMIVYTDDKYVNRGEIISVPLKMSKYGGITGLQFTFEFNEEYLKFVDVENGEMNLTKNNIGYKNIEKGIVTFSWNDVDEILFDEDSELFIFNFEIQNSGLLSNLISISSEITPIGVFDDENSIKDLVLEFRNQGGKEFVLYQNEPNPWSFSTDFKFDLPERGEVKVKVTNGYGALITTFLIDGNKGINKITIDKNNVNYSGLMFVDFEYKGKHLVKRMIRLK